MDIIGVSNRMRHFTYTQVAGSKQDFCFIHSGLNDIIPNANTLALLEVFAELIITNIQVVANRFYPQL